MRSEDAAAIVATFRGLFVHSLVLLLAPTALLYMLLIHAHCEMIYVH